MQYRILIEPKESKDGEPWDDTGEVFDDKAGDVNVHLVALQAKDGRSFAAEAINPK